MGIHMGKLEFVLEVRHGAETANNRACAARTSVLDGKAGEALDSDVLDFGECPNGETLGTRPNQLIRTALYGYDNFLVLDMRGRQPIQYRNE